MRPFPTRLLAAAAVAGASVSGAGAGDDGGPPKLEDTPRLSVRGEAELERPADQVRLNIGVVTEAAEAAEALEANSTLMIGVVGALEREGLGADEYETGRFRVRPNYSRRPRQPAADWKPQIIGYEVLNSVVVKTKKLDRTGDLLEAANKAGANTVEVVGFELSDQRRYRAEAIREATANALTDARALADAASLDLVRIIAINLDHTPVRAPAMAFEARGRAMAATDEPPPVHPGHVTVRAAVTVAYEIAPREPS